MRPNALVSGMQYSTQSYFEAFLLFEIFKQFQWSQTADKKWFLWFEVDDGEWIIQRMCIFVMTDDARATNLLNCIPISIGWCMMSLRLAKIMVKFPSGLRKTFHGYRIYKSKKNDFPNRINCENQIPFIQLFANICQLLSSDNFELWICCQKIWKKVCQCNFYSKNNSNIFSNPLEWIRTALCFKLQTSEINM